MENLTSSDLAQIQLLLIEEYLKDKNVLPTEQEINEATQIAKNIDTEKLEARLRKILVDRNTI